MADADAAPRFRAVGDRACLIDLPDLASVLRVSGRLRALQRDGELRGVIEIVPAARTVLVVCDSRAAVRRVGAAPIIGEDGSGSLVERRPEAASREVAVDVIYDGQDLGTVAGLTGLSEEAVVAAHTGATWHAAFGGFAPGFVYLAGGDQRLRVPRLDSPRTSVPAGAVAIAGEFSAVYPSASPGGWRLLGRTTEQVWDAARSEPARIVPGDTVRFRAVREVIELPATADAEATETPPHLEQPDPRRTLTVVDPGLLALVEDGGRPGLAALGVTRSGAMDRAALARANRVVGNPPDAPAIEAVYGGLAVRAEGRVHVAVAGSDGEVSVESPSGVRRRALGGGPIELGAGDTLRIGAPERCFRCYVAVRGGIDADVVLGSRSRDVLSGLGPRPLRAGDRIGIADAAGVTGPADLAGVNGGGNAGGGATLRFVPGPRADWFAPAALEALSVAAWTVTPDSNRIGARLDGGGVRLERHRLGELPSEGMVRGSIQVPPNGLPVLFLADHPVTGGYPVIGTVIDADLDRAGQLGPGDEVRFVSVDPDGVEEPPARGAASRQPAPSRRLVTEFSIEVDGRRRWVRIPDELAAILAGLLELPDEAPLQDALAALVAALETEPESGSTRNR